jgi:hypothetical protein
MNMAFLPCDNLQTLELSADPSRLRLPRVRECGENHMIFRVLAAAGLEKGKKCPPALACERRAA